MPMQPLTRIVQKNQLVKAKRNRLPCDLPSDCNERETPINQSSTSATYYVIEAGQLRSTASSGDGECANPGFCVSAENFLKMGRTADAAVAATDAVMIAPCYYIASKSFQHW